MCKWIHKAHFDKGLSFFFFFFKNLCDILRLYLGNYIALCKPFFIKSRPRFASIYQQKLLLLSSVSYFLTSCHCKTFVNYFHLWH